MAKTLQSKLPSSDTIRVFDINADSVKKFVEETSSAGTGAAVKAASNVLEASEDSVCLNSLFTIYTSVLI